MLFISTATEFGRIFVIAVRFDLHGLYIWCIQQKNQDTTLITMTDNACFRVMFRDFISGRKMSMTFFQAPPSGVHIAWESMGIKEIRREIQELFSEPQVSLIPSNKETVFFLSHCSIMSSSLIRNPSRSQSVPRNYHPFHATTPLSTFFGEAEGVVRNAKRVEMKNSKRPLGRNVSVPPAARKAGSNLPPIDPLSKNQKKVSIIELLYSTIILRIWQILRKPKFFSYVMIIWLLKCVCL